MNWSAKWIRGLEDGHDSAVEFSKNFSIKSDAKKASLFISSLGIYEAFINNKRVGNYIFAPGWTDYKHRIQYQEYDVTSLLRDVNNIKVSVTSGWYNGRIANLKEKQKEAFVGLICELKIQYADGTEELIISDDSWNESANQIRFSDIYDGEIYDATFVADSVRKAITFEGPYEKLIPQEGEKILETQKIFPKKLFKTPNGETVVDFGQNITGYVETVLEGSLGQELSLSFAEVLDKQGNFYKENYRTAKSLYSYICIDGKQTYKPHSVFYGFRYIRINKYPGGIDKAKLDSFTAIVVHSDLKRTGWINTSNGVLNKFIENTFWGQRDNFLDIPSDCPQRDERMGWTGDAQIFIKTACYNYRVDKFFQKWLNDLRAGQRENGSICHVVPAVWNTPATSAGYGDATVICPWQLYLAYGDKEMLKNQFNSMKRWLDYIKLTSKDEYLWTGCGHYGDWLGLDAEPGSYKGSSNEDLIASAYYAYSTDIVIRAGKILGEDITKYEELYEKIVSAFRNRFTDYKTQTECVLAIVFDLAENKQEIGDKLAKMIVECGHMQTGFIGTPYLLYALSSCGYAELAYSLLLKTDYPSWLYQVQKGATTVWEHWDGINDNGDFWSSDMNSYNHYAYGAVLDWIYSFSAGINPIENEAGYKKVRIAPHPTAQLDWLSVRFDTKFGTIFSSWSKTEEGFRIEIETPVCATVELNGKNYELVKEGKYTFFI